MSRNPAGDTVVVPPTSNIYTVLVIVATVVVILGLIAVYIRASALEIDLLNFG